MGVFLLVEVVVIGFCCEIDYLTCLVGHWVLLLLVLITVGGKVVRRQRERWGVWELPHDGGE